MNRQKRSRVVSRGMVLAAVFLFGASLGCKMLGGEATSTNGSNDTKTTKGVSATKICQMLAHPSFESGFAYDGKGCSGSTYFGAKDIRIASYETDMRPSFSYGVIGENDAIEKIMLFMSKRPDGAAFFAAEADAVAKMINGQPLPKEIEDAIKGPLSTSGGNFTTRSQIGNAEVELDRSNTDGRFSLTFQFTK